MDSLTPQRSLLRQRSFVLFWCARTSTSGAYQMQAVAVGWQMYDITHNPLDLGLVGLVQFIPAALFVLVSLYAWATVWVLERWRASRSKGLVFRRA